MEFVERIAADTNAVVDYVRDTRSDPEPLRRALEVFLPLPVVGELFAGAHHSARVAENLQRVETYVRRWKTLVPDVDTARIYGRLRGLARKNRIGTALMNDLWIAALCIQHDLPLLTNDRGFDAIAELRTIHW